MTGHVGDELPGLLRGELSEETAAEVGGHLAVCAECREDLLNTATAAAMLEDLRRLDLTWMDPPASSRRPSVHPPWGWAVAAALAVLLVAAVILAGVGILHGPTALGSRPTVTVALHPQDGTHATGKAQMLGSGASQRMRISVQGLGPAPADDYYEVWLTGTSRSLPVGILQNPTETFALPASLAQGYSAVEVRLQPTSTSGTIPGPSVLRGNL